MAHEYKKGTDLRYSSGQIGRTKKRKKPKKHYGSAKAGEIARAKAKKAMTSDKAYALPFGETFKQARKTGKETFRWKSKQYSTKTKAELEGAIGAKEKERFARAGKAKEAAPAKKLNIFQKITKKMRGTNPDGSTRTQAEYEAAKAKRIKDKSVAKRAKRKEYNISS